MNRYTQSLTVMGNVVESKPADHYFSVQCQSGDRFQAYITPQTSFQVVQNLDGLKNDRFTDPSASTFPGDDSARLIEKYISQGQLLAVQGIEQINGQKSRFDGRTVFLLSSVKDRYLFEETHWWLTQTARLADQWLDSLFGDKRTYEIDDWVALYHTNLNILGLPSDDNVQECAVLSRLIYGFSAAYLIVGEDRYRKAAEAAVRFQRDAFRSLSHDGTYCFWAFGRKKGRYGTELLVPSQSGDDTGSIPLYEQIYALAGLANYYRISLDWEVLEDIRRSLRAFNDFFLDEQRPGDDAFKGDGGYFSHIDYATMRPDRNQNIINNLKKNWNSVGDHIPAYLVNLLLSLDPQPVGNRVDLDDLLQGARDLLERVSVLILDKFPDPDPNVPYVNERFLANWTPDHEYSWQQNRAIVGHNFKIAWNLTRVASYYETLAYNANQRSQGGAVNALAVKKYTDLAARCMNMAERLAKSMTEVGVDPIRGGCFDAVERTPQNGMPVDFTWLNTKDFWQQEQAILAYLILFGHTSNTLYLDMARRTEAFWNIFFLDREHRGMYFRVTENGVPVVQGGYEIRGGHSDASGYHCFELNYLAHIYNRVYISLANGTDSTFCLHFKPLHSATLHSINVLPDFIPPNRVRIEQVSINGMLRPHTDPNYFQVELQPTDMGCDIEVTFRAIAPGGI
jgi:mannose/cellobiose epimerase-like protein (N-acyl-D-glucosamine 2-epimerase family)